MYYPIMKKWMLLWAVISVFNSANGQKNFIYPTAVKDTTKDIYFGELVSDPYQWMEDSTDPRLLTWLGEEEAFTMKISKRQAQKWDLRAQLATMYNDVWRNKTKAYTERDEKFMSKYSFEKKSTNDRKSRNLLFKRYDQSTYGLLIKAKDYLQEKDEKLDYHDIVVNEEKDLVVVSISVNGSDWKTGYIFDLKKGEQLPFVIKNLKASNLEWHGNTLYFDAYDAPLKGRELLDKAKGQKLYKLEVGTDSAPQLLYTYPDTTGTNRFIFSVLHNKLFLYHYIEAKGSLYKVISCANLDLPDFSPKKFLIYPNSESINLNVVHTANDSIWLETNWDAPNGKVLLANLNTPNKLTAFIPEYDIVLKEVNQLGKNKLACIYLHEGQNTALIYNYKGELIDKLDFPKGKKLNQFYEEEDVPLTTFSLSSFYHPDLLYQISLDNLEIKAVEALYVPYDVKKLETRYVTYASKDGTEVPMYITCNKDLKLNGDNPVLIYAYGGYGTVVEPFYDQSTALFLAHGGVLAVPNVRGGGVKGSDWTLMGRRLNKQNAIDDFIGAAEYLISQKYTQTERIAINGASHGGLLVVAAMMQRPELFNSVIAEAGPYDMLRFHKYTIGGVSTNILEFGTPENPEDYKNLKAYSPIHNIKEGVKYPNLLAITGDSDDRVPPLHSYKFMASLQEKANNEGLYTLYVTKGAGHAGQLTQEDFERLLLFKYYFLFDNLDINF